MEKDLLKSLGALILLTGCAIGQTPAKVSCDESRPAAESCNACCGPRTWGSADYLLWWVRKAGTPPLVVTGSPADAFPGALDQPHTKILYGEHGVDYPSQSGLRLNFGAWLDSDNCYGVEVGGFLLERGAAAFSAHGDAHGQPFLAAPFVNALTGFDNVYFISQNFQNPNLTALLTGGVSTTSALRLWSWEASGVTHVMGDACWSLEGLAGFRQTSLHEELSYATVASNLAPGGAATFLGTTLAPGVNVSTFDRFKTENLFDGGQIGARLERNWGWFRTEVIGKIAFGAMHEVVRIQGATATEAHLAPNPALGGIYAQASNIGDHSRDEFAVVPEIGLNLCFDLTSHTRFCVGYTFLYASDVVRPGDQIDPRINVNRVPIDPSFGTAGGPNLPGFSFHSSSFWAQGINVGLEFNF
jgi:hypothetical protein